VVVLILLSLAGVFFFRVTHSPTKNSNTVNPVVVETQKLDTNGPVAEVKTLGVLLLGYGGVGHEGGYLTDAIQILYIDFDRSIIHLIAIPRDLWVKLPNGKSDKINAVLLDLSDSKSKDGIIKTGAQGMKNLISTITGLKIDYFVATDFVGFQRAVGQVLNGVEVNVSETLDDPWYPITGEEQNLCGKTPQDVASLSAQFTGFDLEKQFSCRYKHLHFEKGVVKMQGGEALEYARSRHGSAEGDVSRGKRQQEVLSAVEKKLISLDSVKNLPEFYDTVTKHTTTDITLDIVKYLTPALQSAQNFKLDTFNISFENVLKSSTSTQGAYIMIPKAGDDKWDEVKAYVQKQISP
jgi:anionic cell wall polymer biosynthesis LytR-Cps2A-Psr (LCP) family protein